MSTRKKAKPQQTNTATQFGIHFGALCPPVSKQLTGLASTEELKWLDKYANAVTLLMVQSILSEAEAHNARKRILKRAEQVIREFAAQQRKPAKKAASR